ncbi:MFS transporter [Pseudomonas vanderleydeniana]|uniref:MFS transporter n=1 Tax=Pseudomonas vanderleydeniana TaxID=2745495 RepID=A0A9E6TV24_9PSED|nr:MFS transporter [Pseudomonas vanderleydeniana]QXI31482.1 MFS transporter [Pseudomonas vanderleydeniana]
MGEEAGRDLAESITATRLVFLVLGLCLAAWAPLVPLLKQRTGLDEGALGLLLLGLGVGSIIAMPLGGGLVARVGCRKVILVATGVMLAMLPLLATLGSVPLLAVTVTVFGMGVGVQGCAINVQAVAVSARCKRPVMSGFHGMFSLGGVLGALAMTLMLKLGLLAFWATLIAVAGCLVIAWRSIPGLQGEPERKTAGDRAPMFAVPRGEVLFLGVLCSITFLAEGAMLDWSGVFLVTARGLDANLAGLAYGAFACTMTIMRLAGDALAHRLGYRRMVGMGALVASMGLGVMLFSPHWSLSLTGCALVGLGCANIVPALFSAVGRQTSMPPSSAVPAMTTVGYAGVLAGPAFIGFVAHATSLTLSLIIVAGGLALVAGASRYLR